MAWSGLIAVDGNICYSLRDGSRELAPSLSEKSAPSSHVITHRIEDVGRTAAHAEGGDRAILHRVTRLFTMSAACRES